jgi:SHS2 domain-containing protein
MYEIFEHTADFGLRVRAADRNELFAEAGRALSAAMCDNLDAVEPREEMQFELPGEQIDDLLHDWLNELLYTFHAKKMLFVAFDVGVDEHGLKATARGEPVDPARHELSGEIKAITYHALKVERLDDGWLAEVIVDI